MPAQILDYSCTQERDNQKKRWIEKAVEELDNDDWVIPALRQIQEICQLFNQVARTCLFSICKNCFMEAILNFRQAPHNYQHVNRQHNYRHDVINKLQDTYSLVTTVSANLAVYLETSRKYAKGLYAL